MFSLAVGKRKFSQETAERKDSASAADAMESSASHNPMEIDDKEEDLEEGELESDEDENAQSNVENTKQFTSGKEEEKLRKFTIGDVMQLFDCELSQDDFINKMKERKKNGEIIVNNDIVKMIIWILYSLSSSVAVHFFNFAAGSFFFV